MGEKKEYKTSLRSKRWIREAFMELLKQKDYTKITVTDIVALADINRATFYKHYPDVRGLIESIEDEICTEMFRLLDGFDYNYFFSDPVPVFQELIAFLKKDEEFYLILLASDGSKAFLDKTILLFEQYMQANERVPANVRTSVSYRIRISFFAGGIVNLLSEWMIGRLKCTEDDILTQLKYLLKGGGLS